ncbi:MAG: hypothetical protein M3Q97_10325, partial [Bacteroidota bacterium]|nr:hypothetical protein [Bacteroidota bacterium]
MKKYLYLAFAATMLMGTTSCKKIVSSQTYTVDQGFIEFIVPPTEEVGEITLVTRQGNIKTDSVLAANGFEGMTLSSATLNTATFEIISPETANYNMMDRASAFMSSPTTPERRVAYKDGIPDANLRVIDL